MNNRPPFSKCGAYRWWLRRELNNNKNSILFIGLNPSKANQIDDDPTLKRIIRFSESWGYGNILVINLFAIISSSPSVLKSSIDPIGIDNDEEIRLRLSEWEQNPFWDLWLGWGSKGFWMQRDLFVLDLIKSIYKNRLNKFSNAKGPLALGLTRNGRPLHPLYVRRNAKLKPFL